VRHQAPAIAPLLATAVATAEAQSAHFPRHPIEVRWWQSMRGAGAATRRVLRTVRAVVVRPTPGPQVLDLLHRTLLEATAATSDGALAATPRVPPVPRATWVTWRLVRCAVDAQARHVPALLAKLHAALPARGDRVLTAIDIAAGWATVPIAAHTTRASVQHAVRLAPTDVLHLLSRPVAPARATEPGATARPRLARILDRDQRALESRTNTDGRI
jgi:hypothetical protein